MKDGICLVLVPAQNLKNLQRMTEAFKPVVTPERYWDICLNNARKIATEFGISDPRIVMLQMNAHLN